MNYFVDCMLPDRTWQEGTIAWPATEAQAIAGALREAHPDWLVEINPLENTP